MVAGIFIANAIIKKNFNYSYNLFFHFSFSFSFKFLRGKKTFLQKINYEETTKNINSLFFTINKILKVLEDNYGNFINNKMIIRVVFIFLITLFTLENIILKNLPIQKKNFKNLLIAKDDRFINKETRDFIDFLKIEFKNEKCINNFGTQNLKEIDKETTVI